MKRTRSRIRIVQSFVLCIAFFVFVSALIGQEAVQPVQEPGAGAPQAETPFGQEGFGSVLVKTVLSLGVVIALVYFTTFGLKRFLTRKKGSGGASIHVLGSTLLGPKKGIYIIEVEKRRLLLGVTDATISYLTELEEPETESRERGAMGAGSGSGAAATRPAGGTFKDFLDGFVKKRGNDAK